MTAFWFCYGLYIAPGPEGTRICLIGTHEEGPAVVRFQQVFDDVSGGARSRNLGGHLRGNKHFWGGKIEFHEIFPPPRCQNF